MRARPVHDLEAFNAVPIEEQEQIIGRTKPDSVELTGDAMPPDSHVSRTDAKIGGVAQEIYRRSVPYGRAEEHGLYFLAFSCERTRFDILLSRMFGTADDGIHDRLTEFSQPVTGSYWFAPDQAALDKIGQ
jgi:putative iron-dependent peroxidase